MEFCKALLRAGVVAAAVAALSAGSASAAVTFQVIGVSSPNTTAIVDFAYDPGQGKITVDIENTTTASTDPRITGFAFNAPSNVTGVSSFTASGTANNADWEAAFNPDGINSPGNFGFFDIAAITGSNLNGGTPNSGILKNTTATFMFTLAGSNLNTLNENSFLGLLSDPQNAQSDVVPFLVRFQRLDHDGITSDVAVIPLPASLPLLMCAIIGLGVIGRRRLVA